MPPLTGGFFVLILIAAAVLILLIDGRDGGASPVDKRDFSHAVEMSSSASNPNQRYFVISQWSDLHCNTSQLWNTTAEAGVCVNLGTHSSSWSCPPISRNSGLRWVKYASYTASDCSGAPTADHWNSCGECKQSILRECADGYVNLYNCSDRECKNCPSAPTKISATACTGGTPLPQVQGLYLQLQEITTDVDTMFHQWWEGNGLCQSSSVETQKHGWDLIALEKCNNGWMFQCL